MNRLERCIRACGLLVVLLLAMACGCSAERHEHLAGRVVCSDGGRLVEIDLASGKKRIIGSWVSDLCGTNIGRLRPNGALVTTSTMGRDLGEVLYVDLATGDKRFLWNGHNAMAVTDSGPLLWYVTNGDSGCSLIEQQLASGSTAREIAAGPTGRALHSPRTSDAYWLQLAATPVALAAGEVAYVGAGRTVWVLDMDTGARRSLGNPGLEPVLWLQRANKLLCRAAWDSAELVLLDPVDGATSRMRGMREPSGWCAVGDGDSILYCTFSRGFGLAESYDLRLWTHGNPVEPIVAENVTMFGKGMLLR